MSSSVYDNDKRKDILILAEGPTKGLDDATLTAEVIYPINFKQGKWFALSLHYNESNRLFVLLVQKYITSKQNAQK